MKALGIHLRGYGNRKSDSYIHDFDTFDDEECDLYTEESAFFTEEDDFYAVGFKSICGFQKHAFCLGYSYIVHNVCAYSYSSFWDFNEVVSMDHQYIDFCLNQLFFDIL
jgi:hypothetical protein